MYVLRRSVFQVNFTGTRDSFILGLGNHFMVVSLKFVQISHSTETSACLSCEINKRISIKFGIRDVH
jgi:hypothetical protein